MILKAHISMKVKGDTVRIGELSRRTGVGPHLLRYYEAQKLLQPARGANGYREYAEGDVLTVSQIRGLLNAGLSTQEIKQALPCAIDAPPALVPCPEVLDLLRRRLGEVDERIRALTRSRTALRHYLAAEGGAAVAAGCREL